MIKNKKDLEIKIKTANTIVKTAYKEVQAAKNMLYTALNIRNAALDVRDAAMDNYYGGSQKDYDAYIIARKAYDAYINASIGNYGYFAASGTRDAYIDKQNGTTVKEEERKKNTRDKLHEKKSKLWAAYTIANTVARNAQYDKIMAWADHMRASSDCKKYEEDRLNES